MKRIVILSGLIALISLTSCNSQKKSRQKRFQLLNPVVVDTHLQRNMFHKYGLLKNIEIRALEKGFLQKKC
jgi:membrane fusion protein (multidrug efflux system)